MGSKIAEGKYSLKRKGGKTPNIYLWRNDPEPLSEEETLSEIPTILQTAQASPIPEGLEAIIQGMCYDTAGSSDSTRVRRRLCDPQDDTKSYGLSI